MFEWVRPGRVAQLATVLVAAVALTGCGSSGKTSRTTTSEQGLVSIGAGLRGPAGLHATVYATGLKLMSAFAFDARGRLWVTTSGANTHATDGLYVVSRAGARPVRIAGTFRGPLGLVWIRDRLYVASLGRVQVLSGLTGNHFASQKTILVGPTGGGENNNLVESPAGKLVMGVSASCDHCVPVEQVVGLDRRVRHERRELAPVCTSRSRAVRARVLSGDEPSAGNAEPAGRSRSEDAR